jgi:hypothetical protein
MDEPEHTRAAASGGFLARGAAPFASSRADDRAALERARSVAERASHAVLNTVAERTRLARLIQPDTPCEVLVSELSARVLDACAEHIFGLPGPSSISLLTWARDTTSYFFRVQADEHADRSRALQASGAFRAHVLSLITALSDAPGHTPSAAASEYQERAQAQRAEQQRVLAANVAFVRKQLEHDGDISDDDIASTLIGMMTGSLAVSAKALSEALALAPVDARDRIQWPKLEPASTPAVEHACPHAAAGVQFPLYDGIVAAPLAAAERGSLDAVYRRYAGNGAYPLGERLSAQLGDTVIVWLGGALKHDPNYLFGLGVHTCPGTDLGKAILDGVLRTLTKQRLRRTQLRTPLGLDISLGFDLPAS